jgi:cytochrome b6-f complex iron-sulfur subunit
VKDAAALRRTAQASGKDVSVWYRRDVFSAAGWAAVFVATMTGLMGFMRYMFPRVLFEPPTTFKAGSQRVCSERRERKVQEGSARMDRAAGGWEFLRHIGDLHHLGCTPNWFANDNKFKCPCHGSGFFVMVPITRAGAAPSIASRSIWIRRSSGGRQRYSISHGAWAPSG